MWKIIQTDKPSRLIYHISARIDYAYTPAQLMEVLANSPYRHIRVKRM